MISLNALYRGQDWVGVIPFKAQGEIPAIGLAPHRWMWGTKHRLEQLMTPRGLQSVSSNYEAHKTVLSHV